MTGSTNDGEGHVRDLEIAAYLDRGLRPDQMDRIEEHLSRCADCRENVVKTQEIVAHERSSRRWMQTGLFLATAAAVLFVALPSLRSAMNKEALVRTRSNEQGPPAIVAYGPVGESASPVRFVWGRAVDALSYRLTVSAANGEELWTASVMDTSATIPNNVKLHAGSTYVWVVDAILKDGLTRSTGLHEFGLTK